MFRTLNRITNSYHSFFDRWNPFIYTACGLTGGIVGAKLGYDSVAEHTKSPEIRKVALPMIIGTTIGSCGGLVIGIGMEILFIPSALIAATVLASERIRDSN